jgi:hypothetical protein
VADWDGVRAALLGLQEDARRPLLSFPNPASTHRDDAPFQIGLRAWAVDVAAELHQRFGDDVALMVGFLSYPERRVASPSLMALTERQDADPDEVQVSLDSPLVIPSGHDRRRPLRIRNVGSGELTLRTNGNLTGVIVDTQRRRIAGGFCGAQALSLVRFAIAPSEAISISLLVGTASVDPELGYAIPPGRWAACAPLDLEDGRRLWSPTVEVTVTS